MGTTLPGFGFLHCQKNILKIFGKIPTLQHEMVDYRLHLDMKKMLKGTYISEYHNNLSFKY